MTICHEDVESSFVLVRSAVTLQGGFIIIHGLVDVVFDELFVYLGTILAIAQISLSFEDALLICF
jgi:hypothetical protein